MSDTALRKPLARTQRKEVSCQARAAAFRLSQRCPGAPSRGAVRGQARSVREACGFLALSFIVALPRCPPSPRGSTRGSVSLVSSSCL